MMYNFKIARIGKATFQSFRRMEALWSENIFRVVLFLPREN